MSSRTVSSYLVAERRAPLSGRIEPLLLPSVGVAVAGFVGLVAAIGLTLGARWPATTADEGTALSTAKAAVSGNHQWIDMLAPPVQVALYAPFVGLGRPELATVVPALFGALVLLLVVVAAWRITGMPWAGAISGLFLLSSVEYWERSSNLPAYQPFVFFGYLGLLLTASALHSPRRSSVLAVAGGVAVALSAYSFTIGLVFLPAALLLALAWKGRWKPVLLSLSSTGLLLLPFAVWHVAVAGVRNAWFYPHNFMPVKYFEDINSFWNRPDYDLPGYVTEALPHMLLGAAPIWLWLLAAAGCLAIGKMHGVRVSATIAAAMVALLIPIAIAQPSAQSRYAYLTVPAVAMVAGVGLALAVQSMAWRRAGRGLSVLTASGIALLAVLGAASAMSAHIDEVGTARQDPQYADLQAAASRVDDGRSVLARASYLQVLLPDNQVYTANFMSEDEYLDYVLWEEEERVRRVLAGRDIGWVLFQKNVDRWERDYNQWTLTATGDRPRHYTCLPQSAGFTAVFDGRFFTLYKVNQEWLDTESTSGPCPMTAVERWSLPGAWRRGPVEAMP